MTDLGDRLYRTVQDYAALGLHHRTGTPEDSRTLDWFEARLRALGATTERQPWTFDRYEAEWAVAVDYEEVPSIPLFYESVGAVESAAPFAASADAISAGAFADWPGTVERARAAGAPMAVVATRSRSGRLVVPNRSPTQAGSGLPTLLVPGALERRLAQAAVRARVSARITAGRTANVIGRAGAGPDRERLLLTTPLSGWFRCAGERGTGIAVMLAVAERLAAEGVPLLLNGNSGHELVDLGAHRFVETGPAARGIFHFGASIASCEDGDREPRLASGVVVRASIPEPAGDLERAFAPLGKTPIAIPAADRANPASWVGEARAWCTLGLPLVSMAGGFPLFHTPEDIPERATTPALLDHVYGAALAAARVLARA